MYLLKQYSKTHHTINALAISNYFKVGILHFQVTWRETSKSIPKQVSQFSHFCDFFP